MAIELNENQKKAAYYDGDKYLVIEAGPGAGKTRVLIERIKFLINKKNIDPSTLLVITFTHKAAEELKERLSSDIDDSTINLMQISTIHAFCRVILSDIGEYNFRVLGDSVNEKLKIFLNRYRKELGFVNECHIRQKEIINLIKKYDEYSTFNVDTDKLVEYIEERCEIGQDYIDFVNEYMAENDGKYPFKEVMQSSSFKESRTNALYLQIAKSYPRYVELLAEKGFIDFAQMQIQTLDYLNRNPETRYKNILIDEFQDTDPVQMKIFEILMNQSESFTVVGDIDQSIYGFRGANKNYFEYLYNNFDDNVYKVNLNINYRSANQIIDLSEAYIKPQRAIGAKQDMAIGARNLDRKTYFLVNESSESEAQNIFNMIKHIYDTGKIENYNEIAILSRSIKYNSTAKELIQLFIDDKIPYHVRGVPDLLDRPEIRSILTLIHHLVEDDDVHNHKFTSWELDWLNLKAYTGENFNQVLFNLSDETKEILNKVQDDFEAKVLEEEKKAYLKIKNKTSRKVTFNRIFERTEDVLDEIFCYVERPILSDYNLIRYGVKNRDDLEFFTKLNSLKEYINSKEYKNSDDTILDIYFKLLTEICDYLSEDFINDNDNEEILKNLAIISNTFYNYEMIDDNKDLKGVYRFLTYNIGGYSTDKDESEGVQLMTVHKSKGLEFPIVILLSLNDKRFPKEYKERHERFFTPNSCLNYKNFEGDEEIREYLEEEDRIVFVAMTRAQDILILSNLIKKDSGLDEFKYRLNGDLSEIEKKEIIRDIPKGHFKIQNLIDNNLSDCVFLEDDFSKLPKTVCEKPQIKKENFLNLSFNSLEDYVECPFKYKLMHEIKFSQSPLEYTKLKGLFIHSILETVNNKIHSNSNHYIGDNEVLELIDKFRNSFSFEKLKLSDDELNEIKNDILYYYHTFAKDLCILKTEHSFKINKEFYQLSGIIDLIYKTKDGKIGILDYKNTDLISYNYMKNYIKQLYTYIIGLDNSLKIESLKIYAVKARKMLDIDFNQESLDILLKELDSVSQNIENEIFECNKGEECVNCSFSNICIGANKNGTSVFRFSQENILGFRDKFYQHLPGYEITDLEDAFWKDIEFNNSLYVKKDEISSKNNSEKYKSNNVEYLNKSTNNIKEELELIADDNPNENEFNSNEVLLKANLIKKGKKLAKNDKESAIEFYNKLKKHEFFVNDYYPYRKLVDIYIKKKESKLVLKTIEEFFESECYCNDSQLQWFKYEYKRACGYVGANFSKFNELLEYFNNHGLKNKDKQNDPVPIAARISMNKYGIKIKSKDNFDAEYAKKELQQKYKFERRYGSPIKTLEYLEELWNQEGFNKNLTAYKRLCSLYEDMGQYEKVIEVAQEYFNSSAKRTRSSPDWFRKKVKKAESKLGLEHAEIEDKKPSKKFKSSPKTNLITVAGNNLKKLLSSNVGDIITVQQSNMRSNKTQLEIIDIDNPSNVQDNLGDNVVISISEDNYNIVCNLTECDELIIKNKGRRGKITLKINESNDY